MQLPFKQDCKTNGSVQMKWMGPDSRAHSKQRQGMKVIILPVALKPNDVLNYF
jgi:hypothetical protein